MFNRPQQYPMPESNSPSTTPMNQAFGLPNLAHPMNLPYPYPSPPQPAFPPNYTPVETIPMYPPQPNPETSQMPRAQPPQAQQPYYEQRDARPRRPSYPPVPAPMHDVGPQPYVIDIEEATIENKNFRTVLWTGEHLQVALMSIEPHEDIGLENHRYNDQFLRVEQGQGVVMVGDTKQNLSMQSRIKNGDAIMIPAGKWHNVINTGHRPLKLYTIYAPPHHARNTVHVTKADAMHAFDHTR